MGVQDGCRGLLRRHGDVEDRVAELTHVGKCLFGEWDMSRACERERGALHRAGFVVITLLHHRGAESTVIASIESIRSFFLALEVGGKTLSGVVARTCCAERTAAEIGVSYVGGAKTAWALG